MSALALWPAIDLMGGRVVRLLHGDAGRRTTYDVDPLDAARGFEDEGADGIHVVDLDAAFGSGSNAAVVKRIASAARVPVEVGGGLRSKEAVERALGDGAARAVLGSLPFTDAPLFAEIAAAHAQRLVVALDCRDGRPRIAGWTKDAGADDAAAWAARLAGLGVRALLVTDIARDGALSGPGVELLASVRGAFAGEVLASGGVRGPDDLDAIAVALGGGPAGVVLGRALHEGLTSVRELRRRVEARRGAEGDEPTAAAAGGAADGVRS